MNKITKITKLTDPLFVKPISIEYSLGGEEKKWEAVISHNSVSILLWHKERDAFVVVKQLRPPVFYANPQNGYMYELCAGIIDKNISDAEIAREEILEECGYDVPLSSIIKINSFFTSVGISGAKQTLYYAQVTDEMQIAEGGGLEEEQIEVVYIKTSQAREFMFNESYQKTPGMCMAFYWFFENKMKSLIN